MPLVIVALAVVLLVLLMTRLKLNGFVALLLVSALVGLWAVATGNLTYDGKSAGLEAIPSLIEDGLGDQLSSTLIVIGLGAMIGRVLGDAGAAQRIALSLTRAFGERGVQWAMIVTSVIIGGTMFYEVAFIIIVPVAFTLVRTTGKRLMWVALPMSITLSTMHSFLPPHPGPTAVAGLYNASIGTTLLLGLLIALPAGALIAMVWPRLPFVRRMNPSIPSGLVSDKEFTEDEMPSLALSVVIAMIPVVLIAGGAVYDLAAPGGGALASVITFIGEPTVALLISLVIATWALGPRLGHSLTEVASSMGGGAKAMAMIILVVGAGGAFKEVLTAAGVGDYIADLTSGWAVNPLVLAWLIAVILRIALGSATVAVSTAAGIAAPLVAAGGVSPELAVLATACGSIAFSHVNDPGFWLFKEYFNLDVTDAIKARTTYTTVLAVLGLGGVLLLSLVVPA
ncbi:gluconate permease [Brachybacterium endophyticum]|uniref:Gluconate permease n=1 Tax=Brachybacterium endophyticum TaxID=2182385 RepID=A0A2U2RN62_9MICO|nr:gluconate:H+ symporter [Brachybacterium endophyticum]PWH07313.1 gluconate permease [Brachybacterium endophyticum]